MKVKKARLVPQYVDGKCSFMRTLDNIDMEDFEHGTIKTGASIREAVSDTATAKELYGYIINNIKNNYNGAIDVYKHFADNVYENGVMHDHYQSLVDNTNTQLELFDKAARKLLSKYH